MYSSRVGVQRKHSSSPQMHYRRAQEVGRPPAAGVAVHLWRAVLDSALRQLGTRRRPGRVVPRCKQFDRGIWTMILRHPYDVRNLGPS